MCTLFVFERDFLTQSWSKQVEEMKHCFCNTSCYRKGVMLKSQNFKTQKTNVKRVCTDDSRQCVSDPQFVVDVQYWCFTSIATLVTWIFRVRIKCVALKTQTLSIYWTRRCVSSLVWSEVWYWSRMGFYTWHFLPQTLSDLKASIGVMTI